MPDEDDALWGGRAPLPDDLARLAWRLKSLPLPPEPDWDAPRRHEPGARRWIAVAAAALVLAALGAWSWLALDGWRVQAVAGSPSLRGFAFAGRLGTGGTLATDEASRARLLLDGLGEIELGPGSVLRRVRGRGAERRLALEHGRLRARVSAPPRWFVVETRAAVATDLGCEYTLSVARDGSGALAVITGRVAFSDRGHESFVPAGLWCPLRADGVGVPRRDYASDGFLAALARWDSTGTVPGALDSVLARAGSLDAVTLWHLLPRVTGPARARVAERIADLVEVPAGVNRERVLALEPRALDAWWEALGMGPAAEWRVWRSDHAPGR